MHVSLFALRKRRKKTETEGKKRGVTRLPRKEGKEQGVCVYILQHGNDVI